MAPRSWCSKDRQAITKCLPVPSTDYTHSQYCLEWVGDPWVVLEHEVILETANQNHSSPQLSIHLSE